jgi:histone deacetylase complex regulatory component SIN3
MIPADPLMVVTENESSTVGEAIHQLSSDAPPPSVNLHTEVNVSDVIGYTHSIKQQVQQTMGEEGNGSRKSSATG